MNCVDFDESEKLKLMMGELAGILLNTVRQIPDMMSRILVYSLTNAVSLIENVPCREKTPNNAMQPSAGSALHIVPPVPFPLRLIAGVRPLPNTLKWLLGLLPNDDQFVLRFGCEVLI